MSGYNQSFTPEQTDELALRTDAMALNADRRAAILALEVEEARR
jgi:hypothetical protein